MHLQDKVVKLLSKETKLKESEISLLLEFPPDPKMGDLSFPCFILSKRLKKSPGEVAKQLRESISVPKGFKKIEIAGPYLNFFYDPVIFTKQVIDEVKSKKSLFGSTNIGAGEKVLIEHTSINPNASPHVGRARNALIGNSLSRIYRFLNFKTEVHYYVNDIGKQIAMLVLATKGKNPKFSDLLKEYVKINKDIKKNPKKENEVFELLNKLESGDKKIRKQFRNIVNICVRGQTEILGKLNIEYDVFDYESDFLFGKATEDILNRLKKKNRIFIDEFNRQVLDLKGYNLPMDRPLLVLTRSDGTSLYGLRDLAYTEHKAKKFKKNILILGEDQKLYFKQICAGMDLLNLTPPDIIHYSFVLLESGKMSTRSGKVVLLEDFMEQVYKKAEKEIKKRNRGKAKNVRAIGNAAVIYSILKVSPEKNVIFNLEKALSFEGDTGPYLQYTHARIDSLIQKANVSPEAKGAILTQKEKEILKKINAFKDVVLKTHTNGKPNIIANYLLDLAKEFNSYYSHTKIITKNKVERAHRIAVASAVKQTLANGLDLMGIEAITDM